MGFDYKQLPTEREWYDHGHVYFGPDSSTTRCPTFQEMWETSDYCLGTTKGMWTGKGLPVGTVGSDGKASLTEDGKKCVNCNFNYNIGKTSSIETYFYSCITEKVAGYSLADLIEYRFYYELNNSKTYSYVECGEEFFIYNTNGYQDANTLVDMNPYSLLSEDVISNITSSYLGIYCGDCNGKQTWSCKLRKRSTGTWDNAISLGKGKSALYETQKVVGIYGFIQPFRTYNGIEFIID